MELSENLLKLTSREVQVMKMLAEGNLSKQIADHLCVSRRTVECYILRARKKLKASCQAHAIAICFRSGIIG